MRAAGSSPLLMGDSAFPDQLRRHKVVDFRVESAAAFVEVLACLRAPLLRKLLSGELSMATTVLSPATE